MSHHVLRKNWSLGSGVAAAIVVLSSAALVPACGQNAHVTRPNGSGSAVKPADAIVSAQEPTVEPGVDRELLILTKVDEQTQDSQDPSKKSQSPKQLEAKNSENNSSESHTSESNKSESTVVTESGKGSDGTPGADGVPGTEGPQGVPGTDGESSPQMIAVDPVVQPTFVQGPEGPMGPAGISACAIERRSIVLVAAPPKALASYNGKKNAMKHAFDDLAKSTLLPYLTSAKPKLSLLPVGGSNQIDAQSSVYVKDALTLMAFDVSLPAAASTTIRRADLVMAVRKTNSDMRTDTEVLCLNDERICSGSLFDTKGWMQLINKSYFTPETYTGPVNQAFSLALTDEINRRSIGKTIWANDQLTISLSDLLKGSKMEGKVKELLYSGSTDENKASERVLNVVVGDDTYVREAKLVLEYDEDTCISGKRN